VYGIGVPRKTPPAIVEKLNGEINAALADPGFRGEQPSERAADRRAVSQKLRCNASRA
jgi:hypothetical protein